MKGTKTNKILSSNPNFLGYRLWDSSFQRYTLNSKFQEYWQCIHKNSYSFYTKFVNFFTYTVLYKEVQIFELKNHENNHFMKKNQNFEILRLEYFLNTCKYHAKNFFLLFLCDFEHIKNSNGVYYNNWTIYLYNYISKLSLNIKIE